MYTLSKRLCNEFKLCFTNANGNLSELDDYMTNYHYNLYQWYITYLISEMSEHRCSILNQNESTFRN